eukprot:767775-Hanusia_phi.AAC.4
MRLFDAMGVRICIDTGGSVQTERENRAKLQQYLPFQVPPPTSRISFFPDLSNASLACSFCLQGDGSPQPPAGCKLT